MKDIEAIALAIEHDLGQPLPDIREALAQAGAAHVAQTHTPDQIMVRLARKKLALSQEAFAALIRTPVGTLRGWEQGRFEVPGAVVTLMKIALERPEVLN